MNRTEGEDGGGEGGGGGSSKVDNGNAKVPPPRKALAHFADTLKGSNLNDRLYREINLTRVDNFIHKDTISSLPVPSSSKSSSISSSSSRKIYGMYVSDDAKIPSSMRSTLPLSDLPQEFDKVLGPKSRFGDGDGSFWDKWVNRNGHHLSSRKKGVDEEGFPQIQSGPMCGYKTFYNGKSKSVLKLRSYQERKGRKNDTSSSQSIIGNKQLAETPPSPISLVSTEQLNSTLSSSPQIVDVESTHSLNAFEKNAYFGPIAKNSFFEFYREILAKIQHVQGDLGKAGAESSGPDMLSASTISKLGEELDSVWKSHLDSEYSCNMYGEPSSPRSSFIIGCAKKGIIARPSLILRKNVLPELNLESQMMGDEIAVELASSLSKLPFLIKLNIATNGLTDSALRAFANVLPQCANLRTLNVSNNKGTVSSIMLFFEFIASGNSRLHSFVCQRSKLDDTKFSAAIRTLSEKHNALTHLDVSHNSVGSSETIRSTQEGELPMNVAILLDDPNSHLSTLNLGWNEVRANYATRLGLSLRTTRTLTELDLSNNKLDTVGGGCIGDALHDNSTLKRLNVANNNINARACSILMSGIVSCRSLESVNLSNNPIGEGGLKSFLMMETVLRHNCVDINIQDCSFLQRDNSFSICKHSDKVYCPYVKRNICASCSLYVRDTFCWFDWKQSSGEFTFDMTQPYERSICIDILRLSAEIESIKMHHFRYSDGNGPHQDINLLIQSSSRHQDEEKCSASTEIMWKLVEDADHCQKIFRACDLSPGGRYEKVEVLNVLKRLSVDNALNFVDRLFMLYDVDGSGSIEFEEFTEFITDCKMASQRAKSSLDTVKYMAIDENPKSPYIPPRMGTVQCHFTNLGAYTEKMSNISTDLSRKLISLSKKSTNPTKLCEIILESTLLGLDEAIIFYDFLIKEIGDPVQSLQRILPFISSPTDCRSMIHRATSKNTRSRFKLKSVLRYLYRPLIGLPNGYYSLNLSDGCDRQCLLRLRAISNVDAESRVNSQMGDISQDGTYFGFRNSTLNGVKIVLGHEWFNGVIPQQGKLEFDFVKVVGLDSHTNSISDRRFLRIINEICLCEESEIESKLRPQLEDLATDNNSVHTYDSEVALEISCQLRKMYDGDGRGDPHRVLVTLSDLDNMQRYDQDTVKGTSSLYVGAHLEPLRSRAHRSFSSYDVNGDGAITYRELGDIIRLFSGKKPSHKELLEFSSEFDIDGDGCIDFEEFVAMLALRITPNMFCICYLEIIEEMFATRCITCAQLALLITIFPGGEVNISARGGNYRVEIVVRLYSCITDVHNIGAISKSLTTDEFSRIIYRLGWLTCGFHPLKLYGFKVLDLSRREERHVYKMIMLLSVLESNELTDQFYKFSHDEEIVEEALKKEWLIEHNIPDSLIVGFNFTPRVGEGDPDTFHRNVLCRLVNSFPRGIADESTNQTDINAIARDNGIDFVLMED